MELNYSMNGLHNIWMDKHFFSGGFKGSFFLAQDIICILWFLVNYAFVGVVASILFCNLDILKQCFDFTSHWRTTCIISAGLLLILFSSVIFSLHLSFWSSSWRSLFSVFCWHMKLISDINKSYCQIVCSGRRHFLLVSRSRWKCCAA